MRHVPMLSAPTVGTPPSNMQRWHTPYSFRGVQSIVRQWLSRDLLDGTALADTVLPRYEPLVQTLILSCELGYEYGDKYWATYQADHAPPRDPLDPPPPERLTSYKPFTDNWRKNGAPSEADPWRTDRTNQAAFTTALTVGAFTVAAHQ